MSTETLYSQHSFLFPFKWDILKGKKFKELNYHERTDIVELSKIINHDIWEAKNFDIKKNYNEFEYFYPHIRDALYTDLVNNHIDEKKIDPDKDTISLYFEHKDFKDRNKKFIIKKSFSEEDKVNGKNKIRSYEVQEQYELEITSVILRIFETGIGVLSFHVENKKYKLVEDVLRINDYGRRLYEPFQGAKGNQTAEEISIGKFKNTFSGIENRLKIIEDILGQPFYYHDEISYTENSYKDPLKKIQFQQVLDDRMYTLSWIGNNSFINNLTEFKEKEGNYQYIYSDNWYEYVFVDGNGKTCNSKIMQKELIEKSTYDRWIDDGTLYGISRYSFVMATNEEDFAKDILRTHLDSMYYQMAVLSLVQRASIIRFSGEVARISSLENKKAFITQEISSIYKNYIQFINRIYFREVTAQEQGIELYSMIIESMNVEREVKDLDNEIQELHNYATLIEDKTINDKMNRITVIGILLAFPSFITGFFGMNIFNDIFTDFSPEKIFSSPVISKWFGLFILLPILLIVLEEKLSIIEKLKKKINFWAVYIITCIIFLYLIRRG